MTIARRNILGLIAARAATALAGCGGGDGPSSRSVRVLNLNPDFPSAEVTIRNTVVASILLFKKLTDPIGVAFGAYTITFRDRTGSVPLVDFPNIPANENSAIEVFYRNRIGSTVGLQPLLENSPPFVINLFDSTESLIVELVDEFGTVQRPEPELAFQAAVAQSSLSRRCGLRVFRSSDLSVVFDSGPVLLTRPRAILLFPLSATFPFNPIFGRVGVMALDYNGANATVEVWPAIS